MRFGKSWESIRGRMALGAASGALLLATSVGNAQGLKPTTTWSAEGASSWTSGGNWESGAAPGEDDIAVVGNGGIAQITGDAGTISDLSITDGMVDLGDGGSLTVAGAAIVGPKGALGANGGALAAGSLIVDGTIDLPAGADLSFGNSWNIATADVVDGSPSFSVGGASPVLARGLDLQLTSNNGAAAALVASVPLLVVDRVSGNMTINNIAGGPVDLVGYSIKSDGGSLSRRNWESLDDKNVGEWDELSASEFLLAEYTLGGAESVPQGGMLDLAAGYDGIGKPPRAEDLAFSYLLEDGRVLDGIVEYAGPANDLVLNINPETGEAVLQNTSTLIDPIDVASYAVLSESGSLLVDNFSGLGADGFIPANPQSSALTELSLENSKLFETGTTAALGSIFDPAGPRDLILEYSTAEGFARVGTVMYGSGAPPVVMPPAGIDGDVDGDGAVGFSDFLILSANFGMAGGPAAGDIDGDGSIGFSDFLTLSANFGQSAGVAVPEPATGLMALFGVLGLLGFRRRAPRATSVACAALALGLIGSVSSQSAMAVDFDTRFIRLHPAGPNAQITNAVEAMGILDGTVIDIIKNDDITGKLDFIDLAGGTGDFQSDTPYLNGVADDTMDDFVQQVTGTLSIPEGTWTIGFASDDGGYLRLKDAVFDTTFNESGGDLVKEGDGEILFNTTRGHTWTAGTFTAPAGGLTTCFEAAMFERSGGDSFEVAVIDGEIPNTDELRDFGIELADDTEGWTVIAGDPISSCATPAGILGDINLDGVVDGGDESIIDRNFGLGTTAAEGDLNGDGAVTLHDIGMFRTAFNAAAPAGAAVPEPGSMSLILLGVGALLGFHRRR